MNNLLTKEKNNIETMIYEIRGTQVMLDSDLAKLYQCKNGTKSLNLAVKRNINKFPEDFMFQLTPTEYESLRFQFETTNNMSRVLPYVFTEQGIAMLATVIHTDVATITSIKIMRTFIKMKKYISNELISTDIVNQKLLDHDNRISKLEETFARFKEKNNEIYFDGQIYDAYSKIVDIINQAKNELIVIDGYADKNTLDIISNAKTSVILICKSKGLLKQIDIKKYNAQYNNLRIICNDSFHDRYLLLDRNLLYHCGTSINHAGAKTFSINKIEDRVIIESLISHLIKIIS